MATLNISLPDQLRDWISTQITSGRYSSASDYLRDLIRNDQRVLMQDSQWLANHLQARMATPDEAFVASSAADVKVRVRKQLDKPARRCCRTLRTFGASAGHRLGLAAAATIGCPGGEAWALAASRWRSCQSARVCNKKSGFPSHPSHR